MKWVVEGKAIAVDRPLVGIKNVRLTVDIDIAHHLAKGIRQQAVIMIEQGAVLPGGQIQAIIRRHRDVRVGFVDRKLHFTWESLAELANNPSQLRHTRAVVNNAHFPVVVGLIGNAQ